MSSAEQLLLLFMKISKGIGKQTFSFLSCFYLIKGIILLLIVKLQYSPYKTKMQ